MDPHDNQYIHVVQTPIQLKNSVAKDIRRAPQPETGGPNSCNKEKSSTLSSGALCSRYLSSRAVARQVLSAHMSLTSVFGMGTGGPS